MKIGMIFLMTMVASFLASAATIEKGYFNSVTSKVELTVSYVGGCSEHSFALESGLACAESFPVQCGLKLIHTTNTPDYCEAYITEEIVLDLPGEMLTDSYYERAYITIFGDGNSTFSFQLPH